LVRAEAVEAKTMPSKQIDLEIIIPSFNSQFWLKKTLETLKRLYLDQSEFSTIVTVVDNNSNDETIPMLKKEFRWVKLISLPENIGFARANNVALSQSKARYCMLLNSDVEFTNNSNLDTLINYLDKQSQVGVITPRVEFTNGQLDPACHRGEPTPWASLTYLSGLEKLAPESQLLGQYHQGYKDLRAIHTIDACSGAAMIVRRDALKSIGLLDEQFFMYAEDLDWCRRFRLAGYQVVYHPQVVLIHHKNKSGIKSTSQSIARKTKVHFYNTMLQYYDKHYSMHYPSFLRHLIKYFIVIKKGAL
jgi:GT2 family glycosyltransferase